MTPDKTKTQVPEASADLDRLDQWFKFFNPGLVNAAESLECREAIKRLRAALTAPSPSQAPDPEKLVKDLRSALLWEYGILGDDDSTQGQTYEASVRVGRAQAALLAEFTRLSTVRPDAAIDAQWVVNRCNEALSLDVGAIGYADGIRIIRSHALASIAESKRAALRPAPSPQGAEPMPEGLPKDRKEEYPLWAIRLYDRADGCKGHYCIGRKTNRGFHEWWNENAGEFCGAGTVYIGDAATEKLKSFSPAPTPSETLTAPVGKCGCVVPSGYMEEAVCRKCGLPTDGRFKSISPAAPKGTEPPARPDVHDMLSKLSAEGAGDGEG